MAGANRYHREATEEWLIPGPRLFIGGPILSQTGGHGKCSLRLDVTKSTTSLISLVGDHGRRTARPSSDMIGDGNMGQMSYIVDGGVHHDVP